MATLTCTSTRSQACVATVDYWRARKKNLQQLRWRVGGRPDRTNRPADRGTSLKRRVVTSRPGRSPGSRADVTAEPFPSTLAWSTVGVSSPCGSLDRVGPAYSGATASDSHRLPYSPGMGTWTNNARASLARAYRYRLANQRRRSPTNQTPPMDSDQPR